MKFDLLEKPGKGKKNVYYALKCSVAVVCKRLDATGEPMPKKDRRGLEVYIGNEPVYLTRTIKFDCISANPANPLCIYETTDPSDIAYLDKLAADPSSDILTDEEYQKSRNPEAFNKALEIERLKQNEQNKNAQIDDLKRQLAEKEKSFSGNPVAKAK
ncbi:hypothetical protein CCP3SC15_300026 [Gammaproteobacteria bacterium]